MPPHHYNLSKLLGGGYNMGTQHPDQQQHGGGGQKEAGLVQESYIKSLIQQIKILELETEYLKNQNPDARRGVQLMAGKSSKETEAEESLTKLKAELQAAMAMFRGKR